MIDCRRPSRDVARPRRFQSGRLTPRAAESVRPTCRTTDRAQAATRRADQVCRTLAVFLLAAAPATAADGPQPEHLLRGTAFRSALSKPVTVSRENAELRPLLDRLAGERHIAILLDRRIDPDQLIDARLPPMTLLAALEAIAAQANAVVRVVGDTVVVGPQDNTRLLKTVCLLRAMELDEVVAAGGVRQFELAQTRTFGWEDLDRPSDLVLRIAQRSGLQVAGLEQVPHDLWGGGVAAGMTCTEALSWVLIQYGLTFEWTDAGGGIRIVPLADVPGLERRHAVQGIAPDVALRRVRERFPKMPARLDGREIVATGLAEEHEEIAVLARGGNPDRTRVVDFGPLARRRFSLRVVREPVEAVLQTLQLNGVNIELDHDALAAAGIDLTRKISLDVRQATIQALLEAICEPLGTTYVVRGETVYLPAR